MRKIILTILAVLFSIMLSYAESCSCGQGCLSYQISGCGEESRACCSGTCSYSAWDTSGCTQCASSQCWTGSGCASPESTSRACSSYVANACAGSQTRTKTCTNGSGWSYGDWDDSGCSYLHTCTATNESRNCAGNVSNACGGTQNRTRTLTDSCGSCSYGSWSSWSGSCKYTKSCKATSADCSSINSSYYSGTATRAVTGSCGSCSYSAWDTSKCYRKMCKHYCIYPNLFSTYFLSEEECEEERTKYDWTPQTYVTADELSTLYSAEYYSYPKSDGSCDTSLWYYGSVGTTYGCTYCDPVGKSGGGYYYNFGCSVVNCRVSFISENDMHKVGGVYPILN